MKRPYRGCAALAHLAVIISALKLSASRTPWGDAGSGAADSSKPERCLRRLSAAGKVHVNGTRRAKLPNSCMSRRLAGARRAVRMARDVRARAERRATAATRSCSR